MSRLEAVCTSFREGQFGDHCVTCGVNYPAHPQPDWKAVSRAKTTVRDAQDNPPPLNRAERRAAARMPGAPTPEGGPGSANGRDRLSAASTTCHENEFGECNWRECAAYDVGLCPLKYLAPATEPSATQAPAQNGPYTGGHNDIQTAESGSSEAHR